MIETLLFSNIVAEESIFENPNAECSFIPEMEKFLKQRLTQNYNLLFINAPGFGNEDNYLSVILKCFAKIEIAFDSVLELSFGTVKEEVTQFINQDNVLVFLMGGNPITQYDIIKKVGLLDYLKSCSGLVIGFCAGAINLSKYSIITTDEDFDKMISYDGINRVDLVIEPHYNPETSASDFMNNRNAELKTFANKYNSTVFAVPDTSMIVVSDDKAVEYGKIYKILPD